MDDTMNRRLGGRLRVAASGIAVVAVVIGGVAGVQMVSRDGDSDPTHRSAVSHGAGAPGSDATDGRLAGSSIALFDGAAESPDVTRTVDTNVAAAWAIRECVRPPAPEATRVDFIGGTETGPEYQRSIQIGLFRDAASASAAADVLGRDIEGCAAPALAEVAPVALAVGDRTEVRSVVAVAPGESEQSVGGSIYAITVVGRAVVLTTDTAEVVDGSLPPVDDASPTAAELRNAVAELCRLALVPCAG